LATTLEAKRLGLLRELLPKATVIAVLADPNFFTTPDQLRDLKDAAHLLGQQIRVIEASTDEQIVSGFATFDRERPDALFVASVPFLTSRRQLIIALAARYSLPAIYGVREFSEAGGLMSYGASQVDMWRQAGVYTGRILKGAKPDDLPVLQPTKYEFVINMNAAKALGIDIPVTVLAHADEVIE